MKARSLLEMSTIPLSSSLWLRLSVVMAATLVICLYIQTVRMKNEITALQKKVARTPRPQLPKKVIAQGKKRITHLHALLSKIATLLGPNIRLNAYNELKDAVLITTQALDQPSYLDLHKRLRNEPSLKNVRLISCKHTYSATTQQDIYTTTFSFNL